MKERKKKKKTKRNLNAFQSIQTNYLSWIFILVAVFLLSGENVLLGYLTFFCIYFVSYVGHKALHHPLNPCYSMHKYHHEHNNFFSHFIQILLELGLIPIFWLPCFYLKRELFNEWIIMFTTLFYSSVHNINYGQLKVNKVHCKHHKNYKYNLGPDFFDVLFKTKHPSDLTVENTNHYIPNIVIITLILLLLRRLCFVDKLFERIFHCFLCIFLVVASIIFITASVYLRITS